MRKKLPQGVMKEYMHASTRIAPLYIAFTCYSPPTEDKIKSQIPLLPIAGMSTTWSRRRAGLERGCVLPGAWWRHPATVLGGWLSHTGESRRDFSLFHSNSKSPTTPVSWSTVLQKGHRKSLPLCPNSFPHLRRQTSPPLLFQGLLTPN